MANGCHIVPFQWDALLDYCNWHRIKHFLYNLRTWLYVVLLDVIGLYIMQKFILFITSNFVFFIRKIVPFRLQLGHNCHGPTHLFELKKKTIEFQSILIPKIIQKKQLNFCDSFIPVSRTGYIVANAYFLIGLIIFSVRPTKFLINYTFNTINTFNAHWFALLNSTVTCGWACRPIAQFPIIHRLSCFICRQCVLISNSWIFTLATN